VGGIRVGEAAAAGSGVEVISGAISEFDTGGTFVVVHPAVKMNKARKVTRKIVLLADLFINSPT
jgi:hypothetical protein